MTLVFGNDFDATSTLDTENLVRKCGSPRQSMAYTTQE